MAVPHVAALAAIYISGVSPSLVCFLKCLLQLSHRFGQNLSLQCIKGVLNLLLSTSSKLYLSCRPSYLTSKRHSRFNHQHGVTWKGLCSIKYPLQNCQQIYCLLLPTTKCQMSTLPTYIVTTQVHDPRMLPDTPSRMLFTRSAQVLNGNGKGKVIAAEYP